MISEAFADELRRRGFVVAYLVSRGSPVLYVHADGGGFLGTIRIIDTVAVINIASPGNPYHHRYRPIEIDIADPGTDLIEEFLKGIRCGSP